MKKLLWSIIFASSLGIFSSKSIAQTYDSLKTVQVASYLKDYGFFLEGSVVGKNFKLQMDGLDTSIVINCPLVAEKQFNSSLTDYDLFVGFRERNNQTEFYQSFLKKNNGLGFIMDNNSISPKSYADSIKSLLKIITSVKNSPEKEKKSSLQEILSEVYPNPSKSSINFKYNLFSESQVKINIYDILGKKIREIQENNPEGDYFKKIDFENLRNGVYFLEFNAISSTGELKREIKKFRILK